MDNDSADDLRNPAVRAFVDRLDEAVWVFDLERQAMVWANRAALTLWQAESVEALCRRDFASTMSDPVRQRLATYRERLAIDPVIREPWTFFPDDQPTVLHCACQAHPLPDGGAGMLVEAHPPETDDIATERALETLRKEEERRTERERLRALLANLTGGVLVADENDRVLLTNPALCRDFDLCDRVEALSGRDAREVNEAIAAQCLDPEAFCAETRATRAGRERVNGVIVELADGRRFERDYLPVTLNGTDHGHLWQYRDVTHRKAYEQRLQTLASTDPITGLANRRAILERLDERLAAPDPAGPPTAALMLDIDYFKEINDAHGHAVGDEALIHFAAALRETLRATDEAGRIGGDEFLVLLPMTDIPGAETFAYKLREQVGGLVLPGHEGIQGLSLSIGVTLLDPQRDDRRRVLIRADKALYEAKTRGRGRVMRCAETAALRE